MTEYAQFCSRADNWDSETFARWLLGSFDRWNDPRLSSRRALAFDPLILNPVPENPHVRIVRASAALPGQTKAAFQEGVTAALRIWAAPLYSQMVLRDILRLCPPVRPPRLLLTLRDLLHRVRLEIEHSSERSRTIGRLVTAACIAGSEPTLLDIIADLRPTNDWQSGFATRALRAVAPNLGVKWIAALQEWKEDIQVLLRANFRWSDFIGAFSNDIGLRNVAIGLGKLGSFDDDFVQSQVIKPLLLDDNAPYTWEIEDGGRDIYLSRGAETLRFRSLKELQCDRGVDALCYFLGARPMVETQLTNLREGMDIFFDLFSMFRNSPVRQKG